MNIKVTYCANYNGVDVEGVGEEQADNISNKVADHAVSDCDDDGEFHGDEDDLEEFIKTTVHEHFPNANVSVEFDHTSS